MSFARLDLDAFSATMYASPPEGILRSRFSNKREHRGALSQMTVECELTIDGAAAAVAGEMMCLPGAAYEALGQRSAS